MVRVGSVVGLSLLLAAAAPAAAQPTHVLAQQKIAAASGGFTGVIDEDDRLGAVVEVIGDLDSDGTADLAVGAPLDDDGGKDRGAVWILFLNPDGTVREHRKISDTAGGFTGVLDDDDHFGNGLAALGDLDGDGVVDLAVGAPNDDDVDPDIDPDDPKAVDDGAVWILFLDEDGTVASHRKLSMLDGIPNPEPETFHSETAFSLASLRTEGGDLVRLAVGAPGDDDGGPYDRGAVWIFTLASDGAVQGAAKLSATQGGLSVGLLDAFDRFGTGLAWLDDLDGDGAADLAVGAPGDDDHDPSRGAVWVLFLKSNATLKDLQKISGTQGGLAIDLGPDRMFGASLASPGDVDGDGTDDLVVGEPEAWAVHPYSGALRILFLNEDGTVAGQRTIARKDSGLATTLSNDDRFGSACSPVGDLDGDGVPEIAVGADQDADGGPARGAVWILSPDADGAVRWYAKISDTKGRFFGILDDGDRFGRAVAPLGDLDGDGNDDIAVGAPFDDDGGSDRGAVWILFLDDDGSVLRHRKISQTKGGFTGVLSDVDWFGASLAPLGDLAGDGRTAIAVGAVNDRDGGTGNRGAVWILFLEANGAVHSHQKISVTSGNFTGIVDQADDFGRSLAAIGDLDGDGRSELAVGANRDDDGDVDRGAVWVLFLAADGTVASWKKISDTEGGFTAPLDGTFGFGWAVGAPGDVDGDGIADLAVGVPFDADGGPDRGAAWVLLLRATGRVRAYAKISSTSGGLVGPLSDGANFAYALPPIFDAGVNGLCAGGPGQNANGFEPRGAAWLLALDTDGTAASEQVLNDRTHGFEGTIANESHFGSTLAAAGDLDEDGQCDLVVGSPDSPDGGAAWVLFLGEPTTTTTIESTTTTLPSSFCGDWSADGEVTATDALGTLKAAVGTSSCADCICDTDSSGEISAADALRVLRYAVGQPVVLDCPPCA